MSTSLAPAETFSHALGRFHAAVVYSGSIPGGATPHALEAEGRATQKLFASRVNSPAELACKLDLVWVHALDEVDTYGDAVTELALCVGEASRRGGDLESLGSFIAALARDFERAGASEFHLRLLQSAAADAGRLAGAKIQ